MSTIVNAADVALQATGTRILPVGLPLNQAVNFSQVNGGTKPSNNADVTSTIVNGGLVLTSGGITMSAGGSVKGGQTSFNSGTGFFLGYEAGAYKLSLGNPAGHYLTWDGTNLAFSGDISAASGTFAGSINSTSFINCTGSGFLGVSVFGQTAIAGVGVQGAASNAGGVGVRADNSAGGVALDAFLGTITVGNSTMVTNLNANYLGGLTALQVCNSTITFTDMQGLVAGGTGTANYVGTSKPGSLTNNNTWAQVNIGGTLYVFPVWAK